MGSGPDSQCSEQSLPEFSDRRKRPQQRYLLHCFCTFSFRAQWKKKMKRPGEIKEKALMLAPVTEALLQGEAGSPCSELKMEKRYMKARLTGPQANRAKPQVIPRRKVRLTTLRRFRSTCGTTATLA